MLFYSVLTIPKLSKADRGLYKCHVTSGPSKRDTNTTVIVYGEVLEFYPPPHTYCTFSQMDLYSLFTAFYLSVVHMYVSDCPIFLSVCSQTSLSFDSSTEIAMWFRLLRDRNRSVLLQN